MKQNSDDMENQERMRDDLSRLAEDARALIAATADVAGEKVAAARQRLAQALDNGKEMYGRVREQAAEKARVVDAQVHEKPYQAMGIALGVGVVLGALISSRCGSSRRE